MYVSVRCRVTSVSPSKTTKSIEVHAVWVWIRKAQGTIGVLDGTGISYEKKHLLGNGNAWA